MIRQMASINYGGRLRTISTIPLTPFLARKGEKENKIFEGHPQSPGRGALSLCTPPFDFTLNTYRQRIALIRGFGEI